MDRRCPSGGCGGHWGSILGRPGVFPFAACRNRVSRGEGAVGLATPEVDRRHYAGPTQNRRLDHRDGPGGRCNAGGVVADRERHRVLQPAISLPLRRVMLGFHLVPAARPHDLRRFRPHGQCEVDEQEGHDHGARAQPLADEARAPRPLGNGGRGARAGDARWTA